MKRLSRTLRLVAVSVAVPVPALLAAGTGLAQDAAEGKAATLLRSVEGGDAEAQFVLGFMLFGAPGFERDEAQAWTWIRRSAEGGFARAQTMLGEMRVGMGVPRDHVAAYKWLDVADRLSESLPAAPTAARPEALRERIDRLAERMTAEQVAEAQRAADAFVETYRYL